MNLRNNIPSNLKVIARVILGVPLTLVSFYFVLSIIFQHREQAAALLSKSNPITIVLGVFFFCLYFFIRGFAWKKMLKQEGFSVDLEHALFLYQWSEIKRYIPGNIFSFLARTAHFEEKKIPKNVTLKLILLESLFLILSASIASIPSLYLTIKTSYFNLFLFPLIIFSFCLFALVFFWKQVIQYALRYRNVVSILVLAWFFFGLGNFFVAISISYLDPYFFLQIVSFFALAWLIGYLSFVTPMGLGVREAFISLGLSTIQPLFLASSIAVLSRTVLILSELFFLGLSFLWYRFQLVKKILRKFELNFHGLVLFLLIFSYITYFTYVGFERHNNFFTGRFDLGNMDQTVWNTIHERIFTLTNPDGVNSISRLAIHADFILILLSPLYLIWQDPRMLLFVQTVVLGTGAFFVYLLSSHVLKEKTLSILFSVSYLLNPFVQRQNLYDFHAVTLATTLLLAAFYFLSKKRYVLFTFALLLAAFTKENIYLICFIFGLYVIFSKRKILYGSILSTISITVFLLLVLKFIPEARGGNHFVFSYFQEFGDAPLQIGKNIVVQPTKTFQHLLTLDNLNYIRNLFAPVGFLPVFSPLYLIFSTFDLGINLLSSNHNLKSINYHYTASVLPFIYISSIYGVKRILAHLKNSKKSATIIGNYILCSSLFSAWFFGALPGSRYPVIEVFTQRLLYKDDIFAQLKTIPPNASVSATNNLGAHLSQREYIFTIPNGVEQADFVGFLLTDPYALPSIEEQIMLVNKLRKDKNYTVVFEKEDFILFSL